MTFLLFKDLLFDLNLGMLIVVVVNWGIRNLEIVSLLFCVTNIKQDFYCDRCTMDPLPTTPVNATQTIIELNLK